MAKYIPLETVEGIKDFLQNSDKITKLNKSWTEKMREYRKGQYSILNWLLDDLDETIVEIESRPKGKWIDNREYGYVECPFCHEATNCDDNIEELHYCWNCGAKLTADMRGEE